MPNRISLPLRFVLLLLLLLTCAGSASLYAQDPEEEEIIVEEDEESDEEVTDSLYDENEYGEYDYDEEIQLAPRFAGPRSGIGVAFGIGFTALKPSTLDTALGGDFVFGGFEAYLVRNGLMLGGAWWDATLYDQPESYDEFDFNYSGFLVGYDYGLFHGSVSLRPGLFLGWGNLKIIKTRRDITTDPIRNPNGLEILERFREQEFFLLRPGFSVGYAPLPFLEFRAGAEFFYPISDEEVSDLREPSFSLQIVLGSNR